ncbi:RNA polymerase sigma24 factor [Nocardioides flavus (ex Wang et al. 2016)]|uniref:RNA polymerase sigma24 factor n=2 Tax=Nocardioides flavus (ex Wang et al. 2016) TaxID=2058780 RepID=A0ABQ3HG94_9ACTN|nr:RNA polymerase sigma-70 factor [Nocardioides flavus (ex Wang et al. 2016)]GHE16625.1 RNA polymerase sigma24 factor [Nocardioides flavus (ex Wang et al. 2016)]
MTQTEAFTAHRALLFTVAYEMLGSAADAEDVLQEVWLRWADVPAHEVRDPRAYLVRMTTRLALNRLRTLARRREDYVGTWLPEPLLTAPDVAQDVELADSVSTAMLLVLETLPPTERAVFVLREVFDVPYAEIAEAVGKSEPAVRQVASRARAHVAERRPWASVSPAERDAVIERFRAATQTGDLQGLMDALAPDVVLMTDGGGRVKAALNPIIGREKVLRFLTAVTPEALELEPVWLNGSPAIQFVVGGQRDGVGTMLVEDGVVTRLFLVRNPDKLRAVDEEVGLSR